MQLVETWSQACSRTGERWKAPISSARPGHPRTVRPSAQPGGRGQGRETGCQGAERKRWPPIYIVSAEGGDHGGVG